MRQRTAITVTLFVVTCGPLFAQNDQQRQRPDSFQQFFTLPGIEFSKEQQSKVEEIRKQFSAMLADNQRKWIEVITDEQRQVRNEAFQKARDAGKEGQQLRDAVDAAVKLTDEQKKQQAAIQEERN